MVKAFKVNGANVENMMYIVCKMHEYLAGMVPFMTDKEVSQIVPIFARVSSAFMRLQSNKTSLK